LFIIFFAALFVFFCYRSGIATQQNIPPIVTVLNNSNNSLSETRGAVCKIKSNVRSAFINAVGSVLFSGDGGISGNSGNGGDGGCIF
jgi:hypothetical protein